MKKIILLALVLGALPLWTSVGLCAGNSIWIDFSPPLWQPPEFVLFGKVAPGGEMVLPTNIFGLYPAKQGLFTDRKDLHFYIGAIFYMNRPYVTNSSLPPPFTDVTVEVGSQQIFLSGFLDKSGPLKFTDFNWTLDIGIRTFSGTAEDRGPYLDTHEEMEINFGSITIPLTWVLDSVFEDNYY